MKFITWLFKVFGKPLSDWWWVKWSNFRWRKSIRHNIGITPEDEIGNMVDLSALVKKLYSYFTWTSDGVTELFDSMTPPPQNYQNYLNGHLYDDCDGFHALVYHCLYNNNIECYLLSTVAVGAGHCILLFKDFDKKWRVNDYTRIYGGFDTPQEAIENYNEKYVKIYKAKSEVCFNNLIKYNYETGKFEKVDLQDLK